MSGEKIVTDFGGYLKLADCGEEIYLDPSTDQDYIEKLISNEEERRTA